MFRSSGSRCATLVHPRGCFVDDVDWYRRFTFSSTDTCTILLFPLLSHEYEVWEKDDMSRAQLVYYRRSDIFEGNAETQLYAERGTQTISYTANHKFTEICMFNSTNPMPKSKFNI